MGELNPLREAVVHTALPASDLERAKRFYADKLGLTPSSETESTAFYEVRDGKLALFASGDEPSGDHTQIGWVVDDIEATVAELWFRDSEANVHALEHHE